jgi:hypothetical protein
MKTSHLFALGKAKPLGYTATREVRLRRAGLLLRCGCTQEEAGAEHDADRHIAAINQAVDEWIAEERRCSQPMR